MEPFLPEHVPEPAPPAPPKRQSAKTLVLWVILIVFFGVVWSFLSPHRKGAPAPPPVCEPPCVEPSGFPSSLAAFVPTIVIVGLVVLLLRRLRATPGFNLAQEPALEALAARSFREAALRFREVAAKYEKQPFYAGAALLNASNAELWRGDFAASIALAVDAEKRTSLARILAPGGVRLLAASHLAIAYALAGEFDAADRWCEETRARLAKADDDRIHYAANVTLARGILACRRGAARDAVALFDRDWLSFRHAFSANWMRVAEVVRAFAEAQGGVREQNVVGERLVRIEPVVGNELAFLGAAWPEMHAFLAAHGLLAAPRA